jgi:hypothetical protein
VADNFDPVEMAADNYHPHYSSIDKDYYQRLADNAIRIANPFRLTCHKYTEQGEARCLQVWEESKAKQRKST